MTLDYNIFLEVAVLPIDLFLVIYLFARYTRKTEVNRTFKFLAVMITVGTAVDVATAVVSSMYTAVPNAVHMLFNTADCVMATLASYVYILYVRSYVPDRSGKHPWILINHALLVLYAILLIQNFFTGNVFSYDATGTYIHGPLFLMIAYLYPLYFIIYGSVYLAVHRKNYNLDKLWIVPIVFVVLLAIFILQMLFFDNVLITFFMSSVILLVMFLMLETPDYAAMLQTMEELEKAHETEEVLRAQAENANKAKSLFLSQMSHEIRTPINAALGYTNLILSNSSELSTREYAKKSLDATKQLLDFIENLLDYIADENRRDTPLPDFHFNEAGHEEFASNEAQFKTHVVNEDLRILVVDDIAMNTDLLVRLLKPTGIATDTAANGAEALERVSVRHYDLIFMDHMMPVMDGLEALQIMREEHLCDDTPVIMITANAIEGEEEKYLAAGFAAYLTKPISVRAIRQVMLDYLPLSEEELDMSYDQNAVRDNRPLVLVIDDDPSVGRIVREMLGQIYRVAFCVEGAEGVRLAKKGKPSIILLDYKMEGMSGEETLNALKEDASTSEIPVVIITGAEEPELELSSFRHGAADFIKKPFTYDILLQRVRRIVELSHLQKYLQKEVASQTDRAGRLSKEIMFALSKAVDAKDRYTNGHSLRVARYSMLLAKEMGKPQQEQYEIYAMGLLHDVGKIGVHESIINKPAKLTDKEYAEIKLHTTMGYEILKTISEMPRLANGARWHHERYDGKGYPDGLSGKDIPEEARIICVADCYDAMTSHRSYSRIKSQEEVRYELLRCKGTQFDPEIADAMIRLIDGDKKYRMQEQDREKEYVETGVLIIDKKREEAEELKKQLIAYGVLSDIADDMDQGLELTGKASYQLILVDDELPMQDFADNILHIDCPVAVLYSEDSVITDEALLRKGYSGILNRPVDPDRLRELVYSYVGEEARQAFFRIEETEDDASFHAFLSKDELLKEDADLLWLKEIDELDYAEGIKNCTTTEAYRSVLRIFHTTIREKADEIREFYEAEDWENYTVRVHGLKSSARVIGARELSELARTLEMAGKEENIALIREKNDTLLSMYEGFEDKLRAIDEEHRDDLPLIDQSMLDDAYETLAGAAEQMDEDLTEMVLEEVKNYRLPDEDAKVFQTIRKMFLSVDWDGIRSLVCKERS